jgi:DNA-binding XRE family transcriptional regulator
MNIDPEFKSLIPPLSTEEYTQLESNLKAEGCRDPLVTWNGAIIDGHNRFEICTVHGISFEKIAKRFEERSEVIEWIIRNQFGRRNLDNYQRTKLALRLEEAIAARAKANSGHRTDLPQKSAEGYKPVGETREEIAKLAGVSRDTVDKVKQIEKKATPEIKQSLAKGEISINKAHQTTKAPKEEEEQEPMVVDGVKFPVSHKGLTEEAKRKGEDAATDSEKLWLLKSTWRSTTKKDRVKFLDWTKQN